MDRTYDILIEDPHKVEIQIVEEQDPNNEFQEMIPNFENKISSIIQVKTKRGSE